jgi:hypothetical protein
MPLKVFINLFNIYIIDIVRGEVGEYIFRNKYKYK